MNGYQDKLIGLSEAEQILADRKSGRIKLYEKKDGKLVVDHEATANALVMFIANIPMDKWLKKILIMRLGAPLIHKQGMSHMAIALKLGMLEAEVRECEAEAIKQCNEFMARSTGHAVPIPENKGFITDILNETVASKPLIIPNQEST